MDGEGEGSDLTVRVAVRCRPFNSKEKANGESSIVTFTDQQIVIRDPNNPGEVQNFGFDLLFDENSKQEDVFAAIGKPILDKAFEGFNGTIFAYGQTGSGKTWSMQGSSEVTDLQGIIPRLNASLFDRIDAETKAKPSVQFLVTASYFEIYNEVIFDLLDAADRKKKGPGANKSSGNGLEIKESPLLGVYVKGLQEYVVDSAAKMQSLLDQGTICKASTLLYDPNSI